MLSSLFDTRVWLVSPTGTILSDSSDYDYVGKNITDSDSDFLNRQSVKGARPKGIMKSNVLAVICPLTGSKETKGYLVLLTPQKAIKEEATLILDTILICYLLLLLVSAIVFLLLYWRSVYPLKQLAHNAKEYADGHFDQKPAKLGGAEPVSYTHLENIISFSANVNPLGISYDLRKELPKHLDAITRYPDREYTSLRKCIGEYVHTDYENILVGNGSTELISLVAQIMRPKNALIVGPTYSEYEHEISLVGGRSHYFLSLIHISLAVIISSSNKIH